MEAAACIRRSLGSKIWKGSQLMLRCLESNLLHKENYNKTTILKRWRKSHTFYTHFLSSNHLACWWAEDWAINSHALPVSPIKFCSGLHRGKRTRFYWRGDRAAWDWKVKIPSFNNIILGRGSNNQNGNLRWFLPWRGGGGSRGGLECHIPILKNDFS